MAEKRAEKRGHIPLKLILFCSVVGALVLALLLVSFSFLLPLQDLPPAAVEPLALLAGMLGCIAAGFLCAKLYGKNGLLTGAACGLVLFVIVLLAGCASVHGSLRFGSLIKAVIFLFAGAIGGVLGVNIRPAVKQRD